ncbi:MAG: ABC transporter ATP-binding protein [Campylobacterota bacterium]|nr:ABC transporter ATP-binding protein [Campylobacterota bacterium]
MSIITIQNLTFSYDKDTVLKDIHLDVQKDDFLAIIGPNGGGKSTLLKLILGFNKIKIGNIKVLGENPKSNLSHIGYVPQNTNINTNFPIKVIEVVLMGHIDNERHKNNEKEMFFNKFFNIGYKKSEIACALGALDQVGMKEFAHHKIGSLSGGQRQRVMIARALCAHPKILILDEPTASIDVEGQRQIYDLLKLLNKQITIIVVSHDISVVLNYANKVAHINKTLTFHDIHDTKSFNTDDQHFCEVELLQMLNKHPHNETKSCEC